MEISNKRVLGWEGERRKDKCFAEHGTERQLIACRGACLGVCTGRVGYCEKEVKAVKRASRTRVSKEK